MKTGEKKKVTLMIDADVYHGLRAKAGVRGMGDYVSELARPHVVLAKLEESYRALARDTENNSLGNEWKKVDSVIEAENVWRL
jgi:hypothetical protein